MKWVYHTIEKRLLPDNRSPMQLVYIRPLMQNENRELMGGKIVRFTLMSLNPLFDQHIKEAMADQELQRIYHVELAEKDYFVEEHPIPEEEKEYYLNWVFMYVMDGFTEKQLLEWIRVYFLAKGYPCKQIEQGNYDKHFAADTNPLLRMFSIENAKKYEKLFGKEWWKKK